MGRIYIVLLRVACVEDLSYVFEGVVYSLDFTLQLEVDLGLGYLATYR